FPPLSTVAHNSGLGQEMPVRDRGESMSCIFQPAAKVGLVDGRTSPAAFVATQSNPVAHETLASPLVPSTSTESHVGGSWAGLPDQYARPASLTTTQKPAFGHEIPASRSSAPPVPMFVVSHAPGPPV